MTARRSVKNLSVVFLVVQLLYIKLTCAFNVTFITCMSYSSLAYSYAYYGPAVDIAIEKLKDLYPRFEYHKKDLSPPWMKTCAEMDANVVSLISDYIMQDPVGSSMWDDMTQLNIFIGNACSVSLRLLGDVARELNMPLISSGGSDEILNDQNRFPTMLRLLTYQQRDLTAVLLQFLMKYSYKDISLLCDTNPALENFEQLACDGFETGMKTIPNSNVVAYRFDMQKKNVDFRPTLLSASKTSRVLVIIAHGNTTRDLMITAYRLGMAQGDYVYITAYPGEHPLYGYYRWQFHDEKDDEAKLAFKSLYFISIRPARGPDFEDFEVEVKYRAYKHYGYKYEMTEPVSMFTALQHTIVLLTGQLINETIRETDVLKDNDGDQIMDGAFDPRDVPSVIGNFSMLEGDRVLYTYVIVSMNHTTYDFAEIFSFDTVVRKLLPVPGTTHTWAFRDSAPPNIPPCGFGGIDNSCSVSTGGIIGIVVGICSALAILGPVTYFTAKRSGLFDKDADDPRWFVVPEEIVFKNNAVTGSTYSSIKKQRAKSTTSLNKSMSMQITQYTGTTANNSRQGTNNSFTMTGSILESENVAMYKQKPVWVRRIALNKKFSPSSSQEKLIKKMKQTYATNVSRFFGVYPMEAEVGLLVEIAHRGSLNDIIQGESIRFESSLKNSALSDLTSALMYLHSSGIQYHGELSSSSCLMDSRFVTKVAYSRLDIFPRQQPDFFQDTPEYRRFFTFAPEQLRSQNIYKGSKEGDIYAYGHILIEIMCEIEPFQNELDVDRFTAKGIIDRICRQSVIPFRPKIPASALLSPVRSLVEKCWDDRAPARPTIEYINSYLKSVPGFEKEHNFVDDLINRLAAYAEDLEQRIRRAQEATFEEKRKAEQLLFQILPEPVATSLTRGFKMDPEFFNQVTIGFTAIDDFGSIAAMSTPFQIVGLLNEIYSMFDAILQQFDVYKVETIADTYMIASGVPVRNGDEHSRQIAELSLEMMRQAQAFKIKHRSRPKNILLLKFGCHTGSCVAGVVGNRMPRYCLFGDAVNYASRLTTFGKALKIQFSAAARDHLEMNSSDFRFQSRGVIDIKGKGPQKCYWLLQEHEKDDIDMWTDPSSHHTRRPMSSPHDYSKRDKVVSQPTQRDETESEKSYASKQTQNLVSEPYKEVEGKEPQMPAKSTESFSAAEKNVQKKLELFAGDKKNGKKDKEEPEKLLNDLSQGHSKSPNKGDLNKRRGSQSKNKQNSKELIYFSESNRHKEETHSPLLGKEYRPTLLPADNSGYAQVSYSTMQSELFRDHTSDHTKSTRQLKEEPKTPVRKTAAGKPVDSKNEHSVESKTEKRRRDKSNGSDVRTQKAEKEPERRREKSVPAEFLQLPNSESGMKSKKNSVQISPTLSGNNGSEQTFLYNVSTGADSLKADLQQYQKRSDKRRKKTEEKEKSAEIPGNVVKEEKRETMQQIQEAHKGDATKVSGPEKLRPAQSQQPEPNTSDEHTKSAERPAKRSVTNKADETERSGTQAGKRISTARKESSEVRSENQVVKRESKSTREKSEYGRKNKKSVPQKQESDQESMEAIDEDNHVSSKEHKRSKTKERQSRRETDSTHNARPNTKDSSQLPAKKQRKPEDEVKEDRRGNKKRDDSIQRSEVSSVDNSRLKAKKQRNPDDEVEEDRRGNKKRDDSIQRSELSSVDNSRRPAKKQWKLDDEVEEDRRGNKKRDDNIQQSTGARLSTVEKSTAMRGQRHKHMSDEESLSGNEKTGRAVSISPPVKKKKTRNQSKPASSSPSKEHSEKHQKDWGKTEQRTSKKPSQKADQPLRKVDTDHSESSEEQPSPKLERKGPKERPKTTPLQKDSDHEYSNSSKNQPQNKKMSSASELSEEGSASSEKRDSLETGSDDTFSHHSGKHKVQETGSKLSRDATPSPSPVKTPREGRYVVSSLSESE